MTDLVAQSHKPSGSGRSGVPGTGRAAASENLVAQSHKLGDVSVPDILEKALDGGRISDDDALALLESRDLVSVGRAAHEDDRGEHRAHPNRSRQ